MHEKILLGRKAEMGVGTLIMFIALLLTAAVAAGVFIQSTGSFQAKAITTGTQTEREVNSGFFVVDISATDGSDGDIENFQQIIKLHPGATPIDLAYVTLVIGTENVTSTLKYRGPNGTTNLGNDGYNTWLPQELGEMGDYHELVSSVVSDFPDTALNIDLDYDGATDHIVVCRSGRPYCPAWGTSYLMINLSTGGFYHIQMINESGLPLFVNTKEGERFNNTLTPIGDYGYITITGSEDGVGGNQIPANRIHLYQKPITLNEDLDDDGKDDTLVINDTHLIVQYSTKGNVTAQLNKTKGVAYPLGYNLSSGSQALSTSIILTDNETSETYATLDIAGTTSRASYIDDSVTMYLTPYNIYEGYYSGSYVKEGLNHEDGVLRQGDMFKLYFEAPRSIGEDEQLRILVIPRTGSTATSEFYMPNIMAREVIHLYP